MNDLHIASLDANLLIALDALLQERQVTRAATRLGLSQSALSHKLRRLREVFDDPLLVAAPGGMLPTPRAEALARPLRRSIEAMDEVLRAPEAFDPSTAVREHRVLTGAYADLVVMPRVVAQMSRVAPGITTRLILYRDDGVQALAEGRAHVVMGPLVDGSGVRRRKLYDEPLVCAVRVDHPDVGDTMDLETYLELGHVVHSINTEPTLVDAILARLGRTRRIRITTPHLMGGPHICAGTDLVYTGLAAAVRAAARSLPLRVMELPFVVDPQPVMMCWHERFDADPGARWLRDMTAQWTIEAAMDAVGERELSSPPA